MGVPAKLGMNRIFPRFVVLVMLAMTLATFAIYFVFSRLYGDPLDEIAMRQASGQIFLLQQYVDQAPADEWLARLNKVREVAGADVELLPLQAALPALPHSRRAALLSGAIVIDVAGKSFYRRVDLTGARYIGSDADVIHAQKLPIDVGQALRMEAIRYAIVALFLLLPIGWWSRAHWRGLQALSRVADDFGSGDLAARATVRRTSSIAPLATRINEMAARIARLLDARKNLLHSVSHELRTPIARLEFGLELLRAAAPDPALAKRIEAMEDDVLELNALVSELLDLAQLDHGAVLRRAPFPLPALLHEQALLLASGWPQRQIAVHIADGVADINGDRRLLARAICNLMGNAAKYAAKQVAISAQILAGDRVTIVIEDDGPGIPVDARERVFEPFYRLSREDDHRAGGYGLGLAIAQKALQLHGGWIAVDHSALGGARLALTIPL